MNRHACMHMCVGVGIDLCVSMLASARSYTLMHMHALPGLTVAGANGATLKADPIRLQHLSSARMGILVAAKDGVGLIGSGASQETEGGGAEGMEATGGSGASAGGVNRRRVVGDVDVPLVGTLAHLEHV